MAAPCIYYINGKELLRQQFLDYVKTLDQNEIADVTPLMKKKVGDEFRSPHFPDEPNILAHIRMNIRTDAEGKKILFIEEIQSDWAQKGKKEGFGENKYENFKKELQSKYGNKWNNAPTIGEENANKLATLTVDKSSRNIPSAPFVTETSAWVKFALKSSLIHAVKEGETMKRSAWKKLMNEKELWIEERMKKLGKLRIDCP